MLSFTQVDFFCLQLDESTDVAGLAVLLASVRYVNGGDIQEDLFLCKTLPTSMTGDIQDFGYIYERK